MFFMNMPLSLVIKQAAQIPFPTLQLCRRIKPVLAKHRQYVKFHYGTHPLVRTALISSAAEIAVTDLEAAAKGLVICDFFVFP